MKKIKKFQNQKFNTKFFKVKRHGNPILHVLHIKINACALN